MEVFPVQQLTPAGVSCFVRLMSHTGWRHSGVSLANCDLDTILISKVSHGSII